MTFVTVTLLQRTFPFASWVMCWKFTLCVIHVKRYCRYKNDAFTLEVQALAQITLWKRWGFPKISKSLSKNSERLKWSRTIMIMVTSTRMFSHFVSFILHSKSNFKIFFAKSGGGGAILKSEELDSWIMITYTEEYNCMKIICTAKYTNECKPTSIYYQKKVSVLIVRAGNIKYITPVSNKPLFEFPFKINISSKIHFFFFFFYYKNESDNKKYT